MAKDSSSSKDTLKVAIVIGIIVVIALLIAVIVILIKGKTGDEPAETPRNTVVTQETAEEIAEEMIHEEYVAPGYYSTQMETEWHFSSGDAVSDNAFVKNDKSNTNDVYFDVFLASDESTPILESPIIPRGATFENIALDKQLEAGTYDCVMIYHLVDENQEEVSYLRVAFTITIDK